MADFVFTLLIGGGIGFGAFMLHKKHRKYEDSYEQIIENCSIESPQSLKMNLSKYSGGKYAVVNGVVVTHLTHKDKLENPEKYIHALKKSHRASVFQGNTELKLYGTLERTPQKSKVIEDSFFIQDPQTNEAVKVANDHSIKHSFLQQKRSTSWLFFDNIKYLALEGSMLTVLGAVEFDASKNTIQLNNVLSIVGGGIDASLEYLKEHSNWYLAWRNVVLFLGVVVCVGPIVKVLTKVGGSLTSKKIQKQEQKS